MPSELVQFHRSIDIFLRSQDSQENGSNDDDWPELEDIDIEIDAANGDPDAEVTIDNLDIL